MMIILLLSSIFLDQPRLSAQEKLQLDERTKLYADIGLSKEEIRSVESLRSDRIDKIPKLIKYARKPVDRGMEDRRIEELKALKFEQSILRDGSLWFDEIALENFRAPVAGFAKFHVEVYSIIDDNNMVVETDDYKRVWVETATHGLVDGDKVLIKPVLRYAGRKDYLGSTMIMVKEVPLDHVDKEKRPQRPPRPIAEKYGRLY